MKHTLDEEFCDPYFGESDFWVRVEHLGRYLFAMDYTKKHKLTRVLDGACGTGYGCLLLSRYAQNVIAVDRSEGFLTAHKKDNISFFCVDLNNELVDEPFDKKFDLITCFETLEHLQNPSDTLKNFADILKPGGRIMLSVPRGEFEPKKDGQPRNPYHLHLISEQELDDMIDAAGFIIVDRKYQAQTNMLHRADNMYKRSHNVDEADIRKHYNVNDESIEYFARIFGYPTDILPEKSYSIIRTVELKR